MDKERCVCDVTSELFAVAVSIKAISLTSHILQAMCVQKLNALVLTLR